MKKVIEGIHVHISKCISKLSAMIPSVSLPAGRPVGLTPRASSYATHGRGGFNSTM